MCSERLHCERKMNGNDSYAKRQTQPNVGEQYFEDYCNSMGFTYYKIGFDEKRMNIPRFYELNVFLRNLPDYVVHTKNGMRIVNVKGTANFKKKEYDNLPLSGEWYSSKNAPLVYAFCFKGKTPIFLYPERIMLLYEQSTDQQWDDGVVYRNLNL